MDINEFGKTPLEDIDWTVRTYNCLKRAGIDTIEQLVERKLEDVIKIRNLGRKKVEEVEDKLGELGLKLKD